MNLAGELGEGRREYLPREKALELLRERTGQDFGFDVQQWRKWIRAHPHRLSPSASQ
jgi:hypothetical protein